MRTKKISEICDEIDELNVPVKEKIVKGFFAFILSLGLVFGPIIFCVNMLIYQNLRGILALGIVILTVIFVFLTLKIYYDSTTRGRVKDINKIIIVPTVIILFIGLLVVYILFLLKVI